MLVLIAKIVRFVHHDWMVVYVVVIYVTFVYGWVGT